MTIALFYYLPAVQLLINWLYTVRQSGNMDLCWYNFLCARPLSIFFAFNNIIRFGNYSFCIIAHLRFFCSNIGYILSGSLLLFMVYVRARRYRQIVDKAGENAAALAKVTFYESTAEIFVVTFRNLAYQYITG